MPVDKNKRDEIIKSGNKSFLGYELSPKGREVVGKVSNLFSTADSSSSKTPKKNRLEWGQIGLGDTKPRPSDVPLVERFKAEQQWQSNNADPGAMGQMEEDTPTGIKPTQALDRFLKSTNPPSSALRPNEAPSRNPAADSRAMERTVRDIGLDSLFGTGGQGVSGAGGKSGLDEVLTSGYSGEKNARSMGIVGDMISRREAADPKLSSLNRQIAFSREQTEQNRFALTPEGRDAADERVRGVRRAMGELGREQNPNRKIGEDRDIKSSVRIPGQLFSEGINSEGYTYAKGSRMDKEETRKTKARELLAMDPTLSARRAHEMAGITNLNQRKAMTEQWKVEDENETKRLETRQASIEAAATEAAKANKEDKEQTTEFLNNNLDEDTLDLYMAPADPNNLIAEPVRDQNMVNMHSQLLTAMASGLPRATLKQNQRLLAPIVKHLAGLEDSISDQYFETIKNAYKSKDPANIAALEEYFGYTFPK